MKFTGITEPPFNVPVIGLETPHGKVVDLYNESELRSVVRQRDELIFMFDPADGFGSSSTALRFTGVRDLRVTQPDDWDPREADQIEHLIIRPPGPWQRVVFRAGGLEYEFNSAELQVAVE